MESAVKSMTGYGLHSARVRGGTLEAELAGVNAKQFQFAFIAPAEFARFEAECREAVAARVARGSVRCRITWNPEASGPADADSAAVAAYAARLKKISDETGVPNDCGLSFILNALAVRGGACPQPESGVLGATLNAALDDFTASRKREGAALAKDIASRLALLRAAHAEVAEFAADVPARAKELLARRLAALNADFSGDETAIQREVAIIADKSDISEELIRLTAHFEHFGAVLKSREPAGRKLDFLCQEIGREANTVGMKAGDSRISHRIINFKALLETIREQAQNIE